MNKTFRLPLIILLFTFCNTIAQNNTMNGYIITLDNDTINGQVNQRSNTKNYISCVFKGIQGEKEYTPEQILGFGYYNDKHFSSGVVKGFFVEALVTGKLSLYKFNKEYLVKKDTTVHVLRSEMEEELIDGRLKKVEKNRWRGVLSYLLSDCLKVSNNFSSSIKLEERSLTRLVVQYNECTGQDFREYKTDRAWTKFEYGASFGISRSEILTTLYTSTYNFLDDSYHSFDPSVGVLLSISSPRISDRVAFQSELHFIRSTYSSLVEIIGPATYYHDSSIELNTLSIPISLKYSFPEKKYGWFLQAGVNYEYQLNWNTRVRSERIYQNEVTTTEKDPAIILLDHQVGYWGGIGALRSFEKFKAGLSIRYFHIPALSDTAFIYAKSNRISLNLILIKK